MYPMKMVPALKNYIWGGRRLSDAYGKKNGFLPVAESWEISCHPDGQSVVANGDYSGLALDEVLKKHPDLAGRKFRGQLPILVKLIDAGNSTSLQVHPPDAYALEHENQAGKNEMWYVLDAKPGASLLIGCNPVSPDELRQRIHSNTLPEIVHSIPVKPGDCFMIPAGMLHAIGAGVLLAEIQQNSNVTYRVDDFGRRDATGNPRTLHIEKALDVIRTELQPGDFIPNGRVQHYPGYILNPLSRWRWFKTSVLEFSNQAILESGDQSFAAILVISGKIILKWEDGQLSLHKGDSVFIPAGLGAYTLKGRGKLLITEM